MSILTGIHIRSRLADAFGGRCYPIAATQGVKGYPFVAYRTEKIEADYTKDGPEEDRVTVTVAAVGRSYEEATTAAQRVREALECRSGRYEGFEVTDCRLVAYEDDYDENGQLYVGRGTYEITTIF